MDSPPPRDDAPAEPYAPPREPLLTFRLRDTWGLVLVVAASVLTFLWQMTASDAEVMAVALSGDAIAAGQWQTLLTSIFLHGGVFHLLMNASALLPFGLIVARRMGPTTGGQLRFLAFYLLAGIAGGLLWLALAGGQGAVVGASGAIFGLWGAVTRISPHGRLHPLFSRAVARQIPGPLIANVLVTLAFNGLGGGPGIAWQAHLGGFVFGIATIGLFLPPRQRV